ncbi:MAG: Mrp/NBP35 family ATP-binding protein [Bacilli bacterium]|nr:Mrp/NBP35 family ATP-binding protein [Bacilli bacterium]
MAECDNNCSACGVENCPSRNGESLKVQANPLSNVKKVIAVVSGKGGVGKSLTTSLLAVNARRKGLATAIIDADLTGPSIPKAFGLSGIATANETTLFPVRTKTGIEAISINLLIDDPASPVIWRGPVLAGLIKQFWTDVAYGDIDELYIDMPPGTGDVPLTVFQSLPIDGIIIVTSPQDLVSLIVEKAVRMARMMNIPVLALVENMAYLECPHCGEKIYPFGEGNKEEAKRLEIPFYASLPIDPNLANLCDQGKIEDYQGDYLLGLSEYIHNL